MKSIAFLALMALCACSHKPDGDVWETLYGYQIAHVSGSD